MRNQLVNGYAVRIGNIFLAFVAAASLMIASATPSFAWGGGNSNSKSSPCTSIDIGHLFAQNGLSDIDTISANLVAQNPCPPFQLETSKNKAKFLWKGAPGAKDIDFHIDPNDIKPGEKKSWDRSLGGDFGGADHVDYKIVNMPGAHSGYGMQITYADYAGTPLSVPSTPLPITFGN